MQSIVLQDSGDQIKHWLTPERGAWSGLLLRSPAFLVLFVWVLAFQIVGCQGTGGTDAAGPVDSAPPAPSADAAVANGGDVAEADVAAVPDVRPSRDAAEIPPPSPPRPAFSVGAPAPIFDPTRVCSVRLDLSDAEWTRLGTAPSEWATAHFTVSGCGATLGPVEVGVRIHGNNPANQNLANAPPLKLNFGFPEPDARLLGMRRLTLHRTDPTLVRETLAYGLFRAAGLPTPATGFARVELHGSDMGVYVLVETSDRHLAERLFPTTGHIYEAEEPWTDLGPHDLQGFEPEVGANTDTTDLTALSDSLDSATLSDRVDWDEVLTYLDRKSVV